LISVALPVCKAAPSAVSRFSGYRVSFRAGSLAVLFLATLGARLPARSALGCSSVDSRFGRAMSDLSELQKLFSRFYNEVREMLAAEYRRGEQDAIARIVSAAQGDIPNNGSGHRLDARERDDGEGDDDDDDAKERAPKGTARKLIDRVLNDRGPLGASPKEILDAAVGFERLASFSGIRFALDKGREDHRYKNKDGKWFRVIPRVRIDDAALSKSDSR
jgi:hypothetical protein